MLTKPESSSIAGCLDYYLALCLAKGQSSNTVADKERNLGKFLDWCRLSGIDDMRAVDLEVLESYQQMLYAYRKPRDGKSLSRGTRRNRLTAVRVFLRCLYNKGVINSTDFQRFELPKIGRRLPKPVLSLEEIQRVFAQIMLYGDIAIRDRAIIETYYATAIRRSELMNLTTEDVDFEQLQVRVNQGKGFKDRNVPISSSACQWITRYLSAVRPRLATIASGRTLFLANNGKPFRPAQLSELAGKYIRLANVKKTGGCNQYRHAAATHMVDNGADIRHVQDLLGHADISTTQVYVHVSLSKLQKVYQQTHPAAKM